MRLTASRYVPVGHAAHESCAAVWEIPAIAIMHARTMERAIVVRGGSSNTKAVFNSRMTHHNGPRHGVRHLCVCTASVFGSGGTG